MAARHNPTALILCERLLTCGCVQLRYCTGMPGGAVQPLAPAPGMPRRGRGRSSEQRPDVHGTIWSLSATHRADAPGAPGIREGVSHALRTPSVLWPVVMVGAFGFFTISLPSRRELGQVSIGTSGLGKGWLPPPRTALPAPSRRGEQAIHGSSLPGAVLDLRSTPHATETELFSLSAEESAAVPSRACAAPVPGEAHSSVARDRCRKATNRRCRSPPRRPEASGSPTPPSASSPRRWRRTPRRPTPCRRGSSQRRACAILDQAPIAVGWLFEPDEISILRGLACSATGIVSRRTPSVYEAEILSRSNVSPRNS
jgi:hypothetical protein